MRTTSKLLIVGAALLLSATYFLPLWGISLEAPQYPEGLGLLIYIDAIKGQNPGDLAKINNLNHYIGMQEIRPESIPELVWMPWIMRALMVAGILVGILGKRSLLMVWLFLFVLLAAAGFYDYYLWGHDYGHNLDMDNAIIKIPGMTYQPPLVGAKQLLNFRAVSWPRAGGVVAMLSFLIGAAVWAIEWKRSRRSL